MPHNRGLIDGLTKQHGRSAVHRSAPLHAAPHPGHRWSAGDDQGEANDPTKNHHGLTPQASCAACARLPPAFAFFAGKDQKSVRPPASENLVWGLSMSNKKSPHI